MHGMVMLRCCRVACYGSALDRACVSVHTGIIMLRRHACGHATLAACTHAHDRPDIRRGLDGQVDDVILLEVANAP
jgi:hypothetical protein